jgi:hypothetical protein
MAIRREPTYLSTDVWMSLRLLAKSDAPIVDGEGTLRHRTIDEIADEMLRKLITEKYPAISQYRKQMDKLERELVKQLGANERVN